MSALDDYSMTVREKLHVMLQASTIATKDGMRNVIGKLLENIKKYPQVRTFITAPKWSWGYLRSKKGLKVELLCMLYFNVS